MIRDAVIHLTSEQPLLADMRALPTAQDACLVCTNLRYIDGRKPTFIDHVDSWFLVPLGIVRFVEIRQSAIVESEGPLALPSGLESIDDDDGDSTDELLRRMRET